MRTCFVTYQGKTQTFYSFYRKIIDDKYAVLLMDELHKLENIELNGQRVAKRIGEQIVKLLAEMGLSDMKEEAWYQINGPSIESTLETVPEIFPAVASIYEYEAYNLRKALGFLIYLSSSRQSFAVRFYLENDPVVAASVESTTDDGTSELKVTFKEKFLREKLENLLSS